MANQVQLMALRISVLERLGVLLFILAICLHRT